MGIKGQNGAMLGAVAVGTTVFAVMTVLELMGMGRSHSLLPSPITFLIFAGIFTHLWLAVINNITRSATLDVVRQPQRVLVLSERTMWGGRRHEWPWADIDTIRAEQTGNMSQLHISLRNGSTVKVLLHRCRDEHAWLAALLRRAMNKTGKPRQLAPAP